MRTIRWGILGCGDVTEVKSGPALQKATNSALVAVMRRDGAKAKDYAQRHGVAKWYDDADALIFDQDVDAVYVATPPSSHLALATRVAAAGKPCYVEKPMAMNAHECRAMVAAFEMDRVPLFVAYYRRALPAFVRAKQLVDSGAIGTVTGVSHRISLPSHRNRNGWRFDPAISGGGLVMDLGSHALNALDWIAGPFRDVAGHAGNLTGGKVEDVASLSWRHDNGAAGSAHFNFASGVREDVLEITGTEGRVRWACFDNAGVVTIDRGDGNVTTEQHPVPAHVHQPLVQTIVDELNGTGRCPSDPAAALRTAEAIDVALAPFFARA